MGKYAESKNIMDKWEVWIKRMFILKDEKAKKFFLAHNLN